MFSDLQRLFQKSVAAFRAELEKREPEDQVAELLSAMRRELTAARVAVRELADSASAARQELQRERELLEQCERRGAMAERIGDQDTARVAAEFAARHRERVEVLERKVVAVEDEHALRQREAEQMLKQYQQADANRFALLAQLRRTQAGARIRGALDGSEGSFADWTRMEERIADDVAYADAVEQLSSEEPLPPHPPAGESEVEARLRELKRRMGKE